MLLRPKKTKFNKMHKGRHLCLAKRNQVVLVGKYALVAQEASYLKDKQISALELTLKRVFKSKGTFKFRVFPHLARTRKPAEVRMGKGKGAVSNWVAYFKTGSLVLEVNSSSSALAKHALQVVQTKLPFRTKLIF